MFLFLFSTISFMYFHLEIGLFWLLSFHLKNITSFICIYLSIRKQFSVLKLCTWNCCWRILQILRKERNQWRSVKADMCEYINTICQDDIRKNLWKDNFNLVNMNSRLTCFLVNNNHQSRKALKGKQPIYGQCRNNVSLCSVLSFIILYWQISCTINGKVLLSIMLNADIIFIYCSECQSTD